MFTPDAWNNWWGSLDGIFGMELGLSMMIMWYISTGMILIGIVVAIFRPRISGIFFTLALIAEALQAFDWGLTYTSEIGSLFPTLSFIPIPISGIFLLVVIILAFTTKKKESYYYSPGYSYGYGRR